MKSTRTLFSFCSRCEQPITFDANFGEHCPCEGRRPRRSLRQRLLALAHPLFECDKCNGVSYVTVQACECAYYGAIAPCTPAERWRRALRWVLRAPAPCDQDHPRRRREDGRQRDWGRAGLVVVSLAVSITVLWAVYAGVVWLAHRLFT